MGLHLLQPLDLVATPRRSALAEVDSAGRLMRLELVAADEEILAALPPAPALLVVDAPLVVPNADGSRDLERVLGWCDVSVFPVSARRLDRVMGGARGVVLAPRLRADGRRAVETVPDLVLRQLAWEREHPPGQPDMALVDYRKAWLGVRAPVYRPKGRGRAKHAGLAPAAALLAGALDLDGWSPRASEDDWQALHDAALLDAIACAYAALRAARDEAVTLGGPERGEAVLPADRNLAGRIALHLGRLRAQGAVRI